MSKGKELQKVNLDLLRQGETEISGDTAWAIAELIAGMEGDVRLAKGRFWRRCKDTGERLNICMEMEKGTKSGLWTKPAMQRYATFSRDYDTFSVIASKKVRHSTPVLPYTIWVIPWTYQQPSLHTDCMPGH